MSGWIGEVMAIDAAQDLILRKIADELPIVLVAGQGITCLGSDSDRMLDALYEHQKLEGSRSWAVAVSKGFSSDDALWLNERFHRDVLSPASELTLSAPWSAVFTTSVHSRLSEYLSSKGRRPETIVYGRAFAPVPRSRYRLPLYHLMGRCSELDEACRMPLSKVDIIRRRQLHASDLLGRVGETATAVGLVIVAGFDERSDWMSADDLLGSLHLPQSTCVLWFGAKPLDSVIAEDLEASGRLRFVDSSLAEVLSAIEDKTGVFEAVAADAESGVISLRDEKRITVTPALRLRAEASSYIVDDEWLVREIYSTNNESNEAFRKFHGDSVGTKAIVAGVMQGFSIERDFEHDLRRLLEAKTKRMAKGDDLIVLHGQASTGKTIALARLVVFARQTLGLPVVLSNTIPNIVDIEAFCVETERVGVPATILVCDANQMPSRYRDLVATFQSRGRKVLVVGSSFNIESETGTATARVHASGDLSEQERQALDRLLRAHGEVAGLEVIKSPADAPEASMLALLYRSISHGRHKLVRSVSGEARSFEEILRDVARDLVELRYTPLLAQRFVEAGIVSGRGSFLTSEIDGPRTGNDAAGKLINFVMVTGRLDCPIPLNLLLRIVGSSTPDLANLLRIFGDLDLFRWRKHSPEGADLLVAPRLRLEAELLCRSRLGGPEQEGDLIVEVIENIRLGIEQDAEKSFLLDLLQKVEKEGPFVDRYRRSYLKIARALTSLRVSSGLRDPHLMLKECAFRRAYVFAQDGPEGRYSAVNDVGDNIEVINEAASIIEQALDLCDRMGVRPGRRIRSGLASERASIYGYLAVQRGRASDGESTWADYLAARAAAAAALASGDSYHPVDVAIWTACDVLRDSEDALTPEQILEIHADVRAYVDLAASMGKGPAQEAKFAARQERVGNVLNDEEMSAEAMLRLEAISPGAAIFLRGRRMADAVLTSTDPSNAQVREEALQAAKYVREGLAAKGIKDVRCQRLLVQLLWISYTGQFLFKIVRGATPSDPLHIRELYQAVVDLNTTLGAMARNSETYLEAVLAWLSEEYTIAHQIFDELSRETDSEDRARVIRRLEVSDMDGRQMMYSGRLKQAKRKSNDWTVRINRVPQPLPVRVFAREFSDELADGRELHEFGVSFNYVGPIAEAPQSPGRNS